MAEYITKCGRCGSREFTVVETLDWDGRVDDDGLLDCSSSWNEIQDIRCAGCGELYAPGRFTQIDFN